MEVCTALLLFIHIYVKLSVGYYAFYIMGVYSRKQAKRSLNTDTPHHSLCFC